MNTSKYHFPLAIQTVLPENYREDNQFHQDMRTLQELGFTGAGLAVQRVFTSTGEDSDQVRVNGTTARISLPANFGSAWTVSGTRQP